ncbi:hypothetical protein DFP73DRAFT_109298 [Morchella snyderi]|nr:hypothetical protein DFP73DRAFT_109298 [Morchella snyderi]
MDPEICPSQLASLPSELLLEITKDLPLRALFKLHLSCRRFHCLLVDRITAAFPEHAQHILRWSVCRDSPSHLTRALAAGAKFQPHYLLVAIRHDRAAILRALFAALPGYTANIHPSHASFAGRRQRAQPVPLARRLGESSNPFPEDLPPLHLAAAQGAGGCVGVLLAAGAHPDARDRDDHTALYYAQRGGFPAVVEVLVRAGESLVVDVAAGRVSVPRRRVLIRGTFTCRALEAMQRQGRSALNNAAADGDVGEEDE